MKYDVIIAGAGPAGAECARYISENSKFSVLLLDRTQEIGEPKKSTAGTFMDTMRVFKLPKKVIMAKTNLAVIEGPSQEAVLPIEGRVLEFGKLKKFLVEEAVHHGADLKIQATVTKPILEKNKIAGVEYQTLEGPNVAKAKIIIDATGPAATLAAQLGLRTLNPENHWIGIEFEMERLKLRNQNAMLFKIDQNCAPGGYSWIFSTGKNHAKVGNCWNEEFFRKNKGLGSQVSYLLKWIKTDERLKTGIPVEMHAGDAYFSSSIKKRSADNFMAVGDAVCCIHPFAGEGIRPGMYSGMFAAQTAIEALGKKDTSVRQLFEYDKKWLSYAGSRKLAHFLSNRLYNLSNKRLDKLVANLRKLDDAAIHRFVNYTFTLNDIRKLLPL